VVQEATIYFEHEGSTDPHHAARRRLSRCRNDFPLLDASSLVGFRHKIRAAVEECFGSRNVRVARALSSKLQPLYPVCASCKGSGETAADHIAAQYLSSTNGAIDFAAQGTALCPICEGLGVETAAF